MRRLMLSICALLTAAWTFANDRLPMLVEGKTWYYTYHHFEAKEVQTGEHYPDHFFDETTWMVSYTLQGDTTIDERRYMKMFRRDKKGSRYYGAFREDEKGRVWQWDHEGNKQDYMMVDYTLSDHIFEKILPINDVIQVGNKFLQRYHYSGLIGVEAVGLEGYGVVHSMNDPVPDCICDYESFDFVEGGGVFFSSADFRAPKYIELTADEQQLVAKNNDFAISLFRQARDNTSKILSPLSITYALGMLNNGAAGLTQQEICRVLGFDDVEAQNDFCLKMTNELATAGWMDVTTKALISNTIFVNAGQGWQLQPEFKHLAANYYYAYPQARNFADGETMDVINKWASDHTEGMIKKVLDEDSFDPSAVSYLLNAIYFKGMWSQPFEAEETREEPFNGGEVVPMMHNGHVELAYDEDDLCQTVALPYGNGTYRMQVFLPREGKTIDDVVKGLSTPSSQGETGRWHLLPSEIDLKLPRFETNTDIDLKDIMSALGMPTAFNPSAADFSKLCVDNHGQNLYIGLMKQVAKIKLDEDGTEAAAVTIIGEKATAVAEHVTFYANRPFLYTISEQSTGLILFIGQYTGSMTAEIETPSAFTPSPFTFNLAGQRITTPAAHGIYVRGGKKYVR